MVRPDLGFVRADHTRPAPGVHRLDVYLTGGTPSSLVTMEFEGLNRVWVASRNASCAYQVDGSAECRLRKATKSDEPLTIYVALPSDELSGRMTISEPGNADRDQDNNEIVWPN